MKASRATAKKHVDIMLREVKKGASELKAAFDQKRKKEEAAAWGQRQEGWPIGPETESD